MPGFYKLPLDSKQHATSWFYKAPIDGKWHPVKNVFYKTAQDGKWHPMWLYEWNTSAWGSCSAACDGGVQSRTVRCKRSDSIIVHDSFCDSAKRPTTQQVCNTHSCDPCALSSAGLAYSRAFHDKYNQGKNGTTTWNFNVTATGRYRVKLCFYVQAPTSGKSGNRKCSHFIGIVVNGIRYCPGDCASNSGNGMVNLPVNAVQLLTAGTITIKSSSPTIAHIAFDLGLHQLTAGTNYYSVTTNTHTDTSTGVYGIFAASTNYGITLNPE